MRHLAALALLLASAPAWAGEQVEPLPIADCSRLKVRLDDSMALRRPLTLSPDDADFALFQAYQGRSCHMELEGTGEDLEPDPSAGWVAVDERISAALAREGFIAHPALDEYETQLPDSVAFARQRGRDLCGVGIGFLTPPPEKMPSAKDRNYLIHIDCVRRPR